MNAKKIKKLKKVLITILGLLVGFLFAFPIYVMVITSFKPLNNVFDQKLIPDVITLSSFVRIFNEFHFEAYIFNSLFVATVKTLLSLVIQSLSAFAFARINFRGSRPAFIITLSTMMIPFSTIVIPLFIQTNNMGLVDTHTSILMLSASAYGVFLMMQFFRTIPRSLDEAAAIDGASPFGVYTHVVLPLSKPIIMTLGINYFIGNWNDYFWPTIVLKDQSKYLIQLGIAVFYEQHKTNWDCIFAASVITSIPIFLLFAHFQKYLVEGFQTSGIK